MNMFLGLKSPKRYTAKEPPVRGPVIGTLPADSVGKWYNNVGRSVHVPSSQSSKPTELGRQVDSVAEVKLNTEKPT